VPPEITWCTILPISAGANPNLFRLSQQLKIIYVGGELKGQTGESFLVFSFHERSLISWKEPCARRKRRDGGK